MGPVVLARHSGYCPLCGRYIAKNRSRITALEEPVRPETSWEVDAPYKHHTNYVRPVDGRNDWRKVSTHARQWVHAACAEKLEKQDKP